MPGKIAFTTVTRLLYRRGVCQERMRAPATAHSHLHRSMTRCMTCRAWKAAKEIVIIVWLPGIAYPSNAVAPSSPTPHMAPGRFRLRLTSSSSQFGERGILSGSVSACYATGTTLWTTTASFPPLVVEARRNARVMGCSAGYNAHVERQSSCFLLHTSPSIRVHIRWGEDRR
jgi:hypothetical protein